MINPIDPAVYVTRLEELGWATALVAITMGIHGLGMIWALRLDNTFKSWIGGRPSFGAGLGNLILVSWMLLFVHVVEVMVWAAFFQWKDCFPNFSTANYFALNEYTTVGSDLRLPVHWRLLEGMIATVGLLAFAWSTGVLMTVARDFQAQQLERFEQRRIRHGRPHEPDSVKKTGDHRTH